MVSTILLAQLKWFTQKLIKMRFSADVDGRYAHINFDLASITANPAPVFDANRPPFDANRPPEQHVNHMLGEIRGALLRSTATPPAELIWERKDGHIEIRGYTTELLKKYLTDELGGKRNAFGEGRDEHNQTVLTYYEQTTTVSINGNELAVFRRLLRGFGTVVSLEELYEEIERMHRLGRHAPLHQGEQATMTRTRKSAVHSAVNEVRTKLKASTGQVVFPKVIASVYGKGYKMIL